VTAQPAVIIITPKGPKKGKGGKVKAVSPHKAPLSKTIKGPKVAAPVKPEKPAVSEQRPAGKERSWPGKLADFRNKCTQLEKSLVELEETLVRLEGLVSPGGSNKVSGRVRANGTDDDGNFLAELLAMPVISNLVMQVMANIAK